MHIYMISNTKRTMHAVRLRDGVNYARPYKSFRISFYNSDHDIYRVAQKECNHLRINNFKKTRDRMKKLCALSRINVFSQQDDTKNANFDESVLILWPLF